MQPDKILLLTSSFLALALDAAGQLPARPGADCDHAARPVALAAADELPDGLSVDDWAGIRAAHDSALHSISVAGGAHKARNPGQAWQTRFDGRGFLVEPDAGGWSWGLELESYGLAGNECAVAEPAHMEVDGARVAYAWDATLEEWYVNDGRGLEHGYTVHRRPAGSGEPGEDSASPLVFTLAVRGDLRPEVAGGARGLRFLDAAGSVALTYTGLTVFDVDGLALNAGFERAGTRVRLVVDDRGARYPLTIDPIAQQAYLKASNTGREDYFGTSIAISGDTVVVGAWGEGSNATGVNGDQQDNSFTRAGAAYVFVRSSATWSQQAYLKASNTGGPDRFGTSVDISGDTVVVGAPHERSRAKGVNGSGSDNSMVEAGAAYVFVRSGTSWSQQAYLKASNTDARDSFGGSVAVAEDTIVIGAQFEDSRAIDVGGDQDDDSREDSGAAYVFRRSGTSWSQEAYLKASNSGESDFFGDSVDVSGDTVIVGALGEGSGATGVGGIGADNSAPDSGAAYIFVRNGTAWSDEAYLKASNTDAGDLFGRSVTVSGDRVAIGATYESSDATGVDGDETDNSMERPGAVYVFARSGGTWSQDAYLKASNTGTYDVFGSSVALDGERLVVGAQSEKGNAGSFSGAAYVFDLSRGRWSQSAYLKASNASFGDHFGNAVAVSGNTVAVGAYEEDSFAKGVNGNQSSNGSQQSGAAYVIDLDADELGTRYCDPAVPNSTGQPGMMRALGSATVSEDYLILSASQLPTDTNPGYFIMGAGMNTFTPPGSAGPICVGPGVWRYRPPANNTSQFPGGFSRNVGTSGPVSGLITSGSTWNFQAWHRDSQAGTSNLTDAVSVTFQ